MPTAPKQPQDRRPSLAKKHTKASEAKRNALMDEDYTLVINGDVYTVVPADLTGLVEAQIRRTTGMSLTGIIETLESSPGIDIFGMFMWAVRISRGEDVDLDEVLGGISYDLTVEFPDEDTEKPTPPEA